MGNGNVKECKGEMNGKWECRGEMNGKWVCKGEMKREME